MSLDVDLLIADLGVSQAPRNAKETHFSFLAPSPTPAAENGCSTPKTGLGYGLSHREKDDDYRYVRLVLSDRWRIASCKDGLQWMLQYRKGKDQWTGRKYLARANLIAPVVRELVSEEAAQAVEQWRKDLPTWI